MDDTVKRLLAGLQDKTAKLNMNITEFIGKDSKVDDLMTGRVTLPAFLESITDTDPYKVEELATGTFMVVSKRINFSPMMRIRREALSEIWTRLDVFKKVYPELAERADRTKAEINSAKCSSCARNSKTSALLEETLYLPGKGRDFSELRPIFGDKFIDILENDTPMPRPQHPTPPPQKLPDRSLTVGAPAKASRSVPPSGGVHRPSCINCCRKHIGQAIVLLGEASLGYPAHRWLAVGHLAEAAEEILEYPETATLLRAERLNIMDNPGYVPNLMPFFDQLDALELGLKPPSVPA